MGKNWLDELCEQVAMENSDGRTTKEATKRVLIALYKVILKQLKINGKIHIPNFGIFEISTREGGKRKVGDVVNGGVKYIYVKPRNRVEFRQSNSLDRNVNENGFEMRNKKSKTRKEIEPKIKPMEQTLAEMFQKAQDRSKNGKTII